MNVSVKFLNRWYIDALIDLDGDTGVRRLTWFYGNLETYKRKESREMLTRLRKLCDKPWVCIGDFNEVLRFNEKGGADRPS